MKFGIYIHIPYCIQKCRYCDFTTFALDHRLNMKTYIELLRAEIRDRHHDIPHRAIDSIYFGGGTPSLLPITGILSVLDELHNVGFKKSPSVEITLEINPGTIDHERLDQYRTAGINRFSLGVQTFDENQLRATGREHSVEQSQLDIKLLQRTGANYSVDFLFGLPHQTYADFYKDLLTFVEMRPRHLSAYNLTVPSGHPMNFHRADDLEQSRMFDAIESELGAVGVHRYEISNYAVRGYEGQHNSLYWNDGDYWGLGVSAHSFIKTPQFPLGIRFWNSPSDKLYRQQIENPPPSPFFYSLPKNQCERLSLNEAVTDFCHTQLRKMNGLNWGALESKFNPIIKELVAQRFREAQTLGLVIEMDNGFALSAEGRHLANQTFLKFTFLPEEIPPI